MNRPDVNETRLQKASRCLEPAHGEVCTKNTSSWPPSSLVPAAPWEPDGRQPFSLSGILAAPVRSGRSGAPRSAARSQHVMPGKSVRTVPRAGAAGALLEAALQAALVRSMKRQLRRVGLPGVKQSSRAAASPREPPALPAGLSAQRCGRMPRDPIAQQCGETQAPRFPAVTFYAFKGRGVWTLRLSGEGLYSTLLSRDV